MDVDRARVAGERVAPDALEQLVARQHEAAVVEQLPEQVELLRRELDLLAADRRLAAAGVDAQVAVRDHLGLELAALRRGAPQDRLDPRDELARVERLRQVVVGADLEPDDLVDVLVARGQHQDRHVGALAQPLADLDPVDVRQHQVEHDQRRRVRGRLAERVGAGRRRPDRVARVLQVERDERRDRALVLDDQDGGEPRPSGGRAMVAVEPSSPKDVAGRAPWRVSCCGLPPLTAKRAVVEGAEAGRDDRCPCPTAEASMSDADQLDRVAPGREQEADVGAA